MKRPAPKARSLPDFVIIGALRSGTTSLSRYLGQHPDIYMAPQKEVHFFDYLYDKGTDWYRKQFGGATTERSLGEATPQYMYSSLAISRMAGLLPSARLIAILRNPSDRAYSHYWMDRARGRQTRPFGELVEAEVEAISRGQSSKDGSYLQRGRYLSYLQEVRRSYGPDSLLVVVFEELLGRPQDVYGTVCRFLGVDDTFAPPLLGTPVNSYVAFRWPRLRRSARKVPPVLRGVVKRLNVRRDSSYPPMDPDIQESLDAYFQEDNAALANWLGRDLSVWSERGTE